MTLHSACASSSGGVSSAPAEPFSSPERSDIQPCAIARRRCVDARQGSISLSVSCRASLEPFRKAA